MAKNNEGAPLPPRSRPEVSETQANQESFSNQELVGSLPTVNKELEEFAQELAKKEILLAIKLAEDATRSQNVEALEAKVNAMLKEATAYVDSATGGKASATPGSSTMK